MLDSKLIVGTITEQCINSVQCGIHVSMDEQRIICFDTKGKDNNQDT
jgi:hypothetical protein